jgi:hypothetical protein
MLYSLALGRFAYTISLAYLLTTAHHHPASLRGLAKWTLALVTTGHLKRGTSKNVQNEVDVRTKDEEP